MQGITASTTHIGEGYAGITNSGVWHDNTYSDIMTEGGEDTAYIDKGVSLDCNVWEKESLVSIVEGMRGRC